MANLNLSEVKIHIKSVLASSPTRMNAAQLFADYKYLIGSPLDHYKFGFETRMAFLRSMPDTLIVAGEGPRAWVTPVISDKNAHIVNMISKQKMNGRTRVRNTCIIEPTTPAPTNSKDPEPESKHKVSECRWNNRVPYNVQDQLRELMKTHSDGICLLDLPGAYERKFRTKLAFGKYGYSTLLQFCLSLPEIFHYKDVQLGSGKVYDASLQPEVNDHVKCKSTLPTLSNGHVKEEKSSPFRCETVRLTSSESNGIFSSDRGKELLRMIRRSQETQLPMQNCAASPPCFSPPPVMPVERKHYKHIQDVYFENKKINVVLIQNCSYVVPHELFRIFAGIVNSVFVRQQLLLNDIPFNYKFIHDLSDELRNELIDVQLISASGIFFDYVSFNYIIKLMRCMRKFCALRAQNGGMIAEWCKRWC